MSFSKECQVYNSLFLTGIHLALAIFFRLMQYGVAFFIVGVDIGTLIPA